MSATVNIPARVENDYSGRIRCGYYIIDGI